MKRINLKGKRYGDLVVSEFAYSKKGKAFWMCICDCGNLAVVSGDSLKKKNGTKSCGCRKLRRGKENPLWRGGIHKRTDGYMNINVSVGKRQLEHRTIIESALGRKIPTNAVAHHVDGNRSNNKNNNLVLCENRAYHNLLHKRIRAIAECGHASWLKCCYCKQFDNTDNLYVLKKHGCDVGRHVECHKKYMVEYHLRRKNAV